MRWRLLLLWLLLYAFLAFVYLFIATEQLPSLFVAVNYLFLLFVHIPCTNFIHALAWSSQSQHIRYTHKHFTFFIFSTNSINQVVKKNENETTKTWTMYMLGSPRSRNQRGAKLRANRYRTLSTDIHTFLHILNHIAAISIL